MTMWAAVPSETLSLIYHSVEPAGYNAPTAERWEAILNEIGSELDRRRDHRSATGLAAGGPRPEGGV